MQGIVVRGGLPLKGTVKISGSKNAALPILMSSILSGETSTFTNIPDLADINTTFELLRTLGATVERDGDRVTINTDEVNHLEAPYDLVKTMRASVVVLGPLLARFHQAKVSLPGGCAIGARPVDQHIRGLEKLGAEIRLEEGYIKARTRRLRGARIVFDNPTVGGTENLMMAAVLAEGLTVLENAAREPEVTDLAGALNAMGAKISGAGTAQIVIEGVEQLYPLKEYAVIPDRIEAGTFMVAAGITGGDVLLTGLNLEHCHSFIQKMREAGVTVEETERGLRVMSNRNLRGVDIKTSPYPGFPTDMQAQMMVLSCVAQGRSVIKETIFENRFMHVGELTRMGAKVTLEGNTAIVEGVDRLGGATVMATDLRASASLILAGLVAEGETKVDRIYHLDRGYENLVEKLQGLGADVERLRL